MAKNYIVISCYMIENELMKIMDEYDVHWTVYFIPPHLHGDMDKLREYLQNIIDGIRNVDAIILTISRCGGGTVGLKATSADLIIPRGADCIDLLLSGKDLEDRKRPMKAMYLTESWATNMEELENGYADLCERHGEETAEAMLKAMYDGYDTYYMIDTGAYDIEMIKEYMAPRAEMLEMGFETVPGPCGTLRKLVQENFDSDFIIVKQGDSTCESDYLIM
ncbi:MAG: DUF1638 domain-containing protein [Firmicutes bacterium]|nr:DUF1638 domain-containing protein [Bacillota bacterium]